MESPGYVTATTLKASYLRTAQESSLQPKRVRLDVAKFSFSNRVVNEWNILDDETISERSLAGFKRKLDRHLRHKSGYISASAFFRYMVSGRDGFAGASSSSSSSRTTRQVVR